MPVSPGSGGAGSKPAQRQGAGAEAAVDRVDELPDRGGLLEHGARAMPLRPMSLAWCESPASQSCVFNGGEAGEGQAWWMQWSENA